MLAAVEFEWWQTAAVGVIPALATMIGGWALTRRRDERRAEIENEATAVDTITDVMGELRKELERAHRDVETLNTAIRFVADELDHAGRVLHAHRVWDEAVATHGIHGEPPPLPSLPRYWEIMYKSRQQAAADREEGK